MNVSTGDKKLFDSSLRKDFTLQRRLSTATDVKYDMYLLSLTSMLNLFGSPLDRKKNFYICHQDLLKSGNLMRFEDLPMGTFIIFVSHQWNGFHHPDPNGRQMQVLSSVLRDLRDGVYRTETDPFHVHLYKKNTVTTVSEWKELLTNAYIWYDWFSQPQPSRGTSKAEVERLGRDLRLALDSVSAYVERADTLMILAPSSVHVDIVDEHTGRKKYTCYRTWRQRGFCVLEFFCANFSRRSTHPVLFVRSEMNAPIWISPVESIKLAVGECDFTCCEKNHLVLRGGREGEEKSKIECSRPNIRDILDRLIDAKATHLFMMKYTVHGRLTRVFKHWWLRGLNDKEGHVMTSFSSSSSSSSWKDLKNDLKTWLKWDKNIDGDFFDRRGVSLLWYAVCSNHLKAATYLVDEINQNYQNDLKERQRRIESRGSKEGFIYVGIPGSSTALMAAMTLGSSEIVELLLANGANSDAIDRSGNNSFMMACIFNRVENVKYWLKRFPDWDLEAPNAFVGGVALGCAVYVSSLSLSLSLKTHILILRF